MGGRGRMPTFLRCETNGCDPSGLQMKSRGSISGGIGWICFNASLKKIERMRVIYIRVLDTRRLRKRLSLVLLGLNLGADVCTVQR